MSFILYQSCTRQVNKNLVLLEVLGQTMFAGYLCLFVFHRNLCSDIQISILCYPPLGAPDGGIQYRSSSVETQLGGYVWTGKK